MDEKYVGRICPYCKQPIHESDEIMVCERCGTAMHKICRQQAGKCVAVGCSDAAPPEESTGSVEAPKSAPLEKQDEPTAHAAMPQRTTEEIFRNPSFCPSCGAAVPSGAESCRQCGFRFASHPAADPAKPGKKIKKSLIALIVCLVLAVAVAAGGIGGFVWYREETEELREDLYDSYWICQELNDQVFEGDLFVSDAFVIFEGQIMRLVTSDLFFGSNVVYTAEFSVDSPRQVTLILHDGQQVAYDVEYREDGPYDRMIWTGEDGHILHFNESGSYGGAYYDD